MHRRSFVTSAVALSAGLAGCSGGGSSSGSSGEEGENATDGYPTAAAIESPATPRDVDTGSFETLSVGDVAVPLVPVDVTHNWFNSRSARFVDARGGGQYQRSHITGSVLSTAKRTENWSESRDGPTTDWPTDDRIVCYCGCPHHLSSLRAGEFISKGYERVYAIDEGFGAWRENGYPVTGSGESKQSFVIRGQTDPADAGKYAWATHAATDQHEAAPIESGGRYQLTLHFSDLTASSRIQLGTPSYELTAPLSRLTRSVVSGPDT